MPKNFNGLMAFEWAKAVIAFESAKGTLLPTSKETRNKDVGDSKILVDGCRFHVAEEPNPFSFEQSMFEEFPLILSDDDEPLRRGKWTAMWANKKDRFTTHLCQHGRCFSMKRLGQIKNLKRIFDEIRTINYFTSILLSLPQESCDFEFVLFFRYFPS
jgi:hypothetical protein